MVVNILEGFVTDFSPASIACPCGCGCGTQPPGYAQGLDDGVHDATHDVLNQK